MTQPLRSFGDFFHEIPEPEIFPLPCGGSVSSECVINSLGFTYTVEVIPRQTAIDVLSNTCLTHGIALGFRILEIAGTEVAKIYTEDMSMLLGEIAADSLPEAGKAAA